MDKKVKETSNNVLDNSTKMLNDLQTFTQIQTDSLNHLNDPLIQTELKSKLQPLVDGQLDKVPVVNIVKISDQYHVIKLLIQLLIHILMFLSHTIMVIHVYIQYLQYMV